jgi:hypothetical protein
MEPMPARLHRMSILVATVTFAVVLAIAIGGGSASAAPKTTVLGAAAPATPSCPDACQAIGKTTGFQTSIGKTLEPFAAPVTGRVVAWSIKLSRPTDKQLEFFRDFFGGEPQARLSILKPITKKAKKPVRKQAKAPSTIYKLVAQSPIEQLTPFLGTTTTFTLQQPLTVRAGHIVALTVPTYAPAFAVNQGDKSAWSASRKRGKCTNAEDIKAGSAHQTLGQDRSYGCSYKTARLLYSATLVADPGAAPPKKKKKPPADETAK